MLSALGALGAFGVGKDSVHPRDFISIRYDTILTSSVSLCFTLAELWHREQVEAYISEHRVFGNVSIGIETTTTGSGPKRDVCQMYPEQSVRMTVGADKTTINRNNHLKLHNDDRITIERDVLGERGSSDRWGATVRAWQQGCRDPCPQSFAGTGTAD